MSEVATEEGMISREAFDWGVRLTAQPFKGTDKNAMVIRSEIRNYRPGRGSEIIITFPAASMQMPLRVLDAQMFCDAMTAIIAETRAVQTEMRTAGNTGKTAKKH